MLHRFLLALLLVAPAMAADAPVPHDEIGKLQAAGRYREIVELLKPFESAPGADAAFEIANARYLLAINGNRGQNIDPAAVLEAAQWAERARGLGDPHAPNLLYMIYSLDAGMPVDMPKAIAYLREAVDKGDQGGKTNYAILLFRGAHGVTQDRDLAARYFRELAREKTVVPAVNYHLGLLTFSGEGGIRKNPREGMRLIQAAGDEGDDDAMRDVAKNYEFGWTMKPDLDRALDWYQQAADAGDGYSQWRIGMTHVNGEGREADPFLAVEWFERAARSGSTDGMTSLAVMYATGAGVKQDFTRARELYEQAAEEGAAHALLNLAGMYLRGEGVDPDPVHGYVLLAKAAGRGDSQAEELLPQVASQLEPEQLAEAERRIRKKKD